MLIHDDTNDDVGNVRKLTENIGPSLGIIEDLLKKVPRTEPQDAEDQEE